MRLLRVLALLIGICTLAVWPARSEAQDDWGLTRERPRPGGDRVRPPRGPRRPPRAPREAPHEPAATADRSELLIERYLRVLEADPTDGFALDRLLELHRERDGTTEALLARFVARVASEPSYAAHMILGHQLRRLGRLDDARAQYAAAIALQPDAALARIALARALREAGDVEGARARLEEALSRARPGPLRDDVLRQLAVLALDRHDLDEARRHFDALASDAGGSLFLRAELARALTERGEHELAIAEYERLSRTMRGDRRALAPVLVELGRAQLGAGRVDEAIATLDRALGAGGGASGIRAEADELLLDAYRRSDRLGELVERLSRRGGRGFEDAALLGRIHDELGHDDEALAAYRTALRARPRDVDVRLRAIQVLARAGRLDDLVVEYRTLIRAAPGEPRYVVALAELLAQTGHRDQAIVMLEETSRRSREPVLHQRLAELYARWGDAARAESELDLLVRLDPADPVHLVALGAQRFEHGERDAAIATWRRILTLGGDRAAAHGELGGILADHDLLDVAVEQYEEAVRLAPESIDAVRGLATTLERAGRDEDAEVHWRRVLALSGADRAARREARERIVGIWIRGRVLERNAVELRRAFAAEPPDVEAGHLLAEAHRRSRDLRAAEGVLGRLAELEPREADTLLALERVRTQGGDLAGAIVVLRRLVDADPRRASSYLQRMAEHAHALYRDDDALAYAREAVERNPDDATAHRRLGDLARARQDVAGAIASYRRALELDDRLFDTAFELAELHLARGEAIEADRVYADLLARAPDDDLVSRAGHASMQIHVGAGTLEALEHVILPLALAHPERPEYRVLAVEVYDAITAPLLVRARRGGAEGETARAALRRFGGRALKPLLEALADPQRPDQRRIALAILGPLGNPAAAPPLLGIAEGHDEDIGLEARVLAVLAAAVVAGPDLAPRFAALSSAPEPRLRAAAVFGLARIGGPVAIDTLRARIDDEDGAVRAWAAIGLGRLGDRASGARLRTMLGESRADTQAAAALGLGWLADRAAVDPLVTLAREAVGPVAEASLVALAAFDSPEARAALVAALFDPDAGERRTAAAAIRRGAPRPATLAAPLPSEPVAAWVVRLAHDESAAGDADLGALVPSVQRAVHDAIASGAAARMQAALGVLAGDPGPIGLGELTRDLDRWPTEQQARARTALEAMMDVLREDLAVAFGSSDPSIRADALRVLARDDDPAAAGLIAAALEDPALTVRRAALDALASGAPGTPAAVARASTMLASDPEWAMRTRAARALGRIGGVEATTALAQALSSDDFAFVREAAAVALGAVGGEGSRAALETACTGDGEVRVREAAARALGGTCGVR